MDVIGNNIANVNTAGYKTSRVIFQDIFSQNVSAGMANQGPIGGTNPRQIGLGIRLSTVDVIHSRAAFQRTDKETDMMINGDGFFIVAQQNMETGQWDYVYTRAGNFDIDNEGYLVTSGGLYVMGRSFELEMGVVSPGAEEVLRRDMIRAGEYRPAGPAVGSTYPGHDAIAAGDPVPAGSTLPAGYFIAGDIIPADFFGAGIPDTVAYTVPTGETWPATATVTTIALAAAPRDVPAAAPIPATQTPARDIPGPPTGGFRIGDVLPAGLFGPGVPAADITVDENNIYTLNTTTTFPAPVTMPWPAETRPAVAYAPQREPIFGLVASDGYIGNEGNRPDAYGLTRIRLTAMQPVLPIDPNTGLPTGYPPREPGELDADYALRLQTEFIDQLVDMQEVSLPGFAVADNGDVSVIVGNRKLVIGQLALAMFANPSGLEKAGNSLYRESASSGPVVVTEAFMDGAGKVDGGGLEMSNVDLANEFTDMIVTQRGFQANSRIITVSDTMLEELVNLKR